METHVLSPGTVMNLLEHHKVHADQPINCPRRALECAHTTIKYICSLLVLLKMVGHFVTQEQKTIISLTILFSRF